MGVLYSVGGAGDVTAPRGEHRSVPVPGPGRQGAVRSATMRQAFQADQEVKNLNNNLVPFPALF